MIQATCWVLIHSLWQGMLLALAGGVVVACTKRSAPAVRYRLLCSLMLMFLGAMGATLYYEWTMIPAGLGMVGGVSVSMDWMGAWCSAHASHIVVVWLILAIARSIWMAAGWSYMRRLRREGLKARALWVDRVNDLALQLGIRRTVKLVESALVKVPMVIGQLRPVIFIPLGLINHLPAGEMEAVLMHELAHVRRYDHVVNLIQHVAECILFYNPGFLWISSLVREERENCCDDMAIAHTRDRVEFVRALVRFSEYRLRGTALAFPGNRRQLLHRVLRISRLENKTLSGRERTVLIGGSLVLLCLLAIRADKAEMKAMQAPLMARVAMRNVSVRPGTEATGKMISVLREREQVAKNLEWVQAQLDQLHRRNTVKKNAGRSGDGGKQVTPASHWNSDLSGINEEVAGRTAGHSDLNGDISVVNEDVSGMNRAAFRGVKNDVSGNRDASGRGIELAQLNANQAAQVQMVLNRDQVPQDVPPALGNLPPLTANQGQENLKKEQDDRNRQQAEASRAQMERTRQKAEIDRQQADLKRQQLAQNRLQEERNMEQAAQNRQQAERNREQAAQNRQQAEWNREQEERNREQVEQNRHQVERNKEQAARDRQQADLNRLQAAKDREQAELNRQQANRDRQQAEQDRQQANRDREQADQNRQEAERSRERAERDREQASRAASRPGTGQPGNN